MIYIKKCFKIVYAVVCAIFLVSCSLNFDFLYDDELNEMETETETSIEIETEIIDETLDDDEIIVDDDNLNFKSYKKIYLDSNIKYATYSVINDGYAILYKSKYANDNSKTITVNAGHGTKGGSKLKTYSHPDFTPKVSGGSNEVGVILSSAISDGMYFNDGTNEGVVNLLVASRLKNKLLDNGYNVLMIRENDDTRLDNIARTCIANTYSDAHIAIHFDYTENNKGAFFIAPIRVKSYLNMEPLKSNYQNVMDLGNALISGLKENDVKLFKNKGIYELDLTQLSYSTIPSVDIELGDKATVINEENIEKFAKGLFDGINNFYDNENIYE